MADSRQAGTPRAYAWPAAAARVPGHARVPRVRHARIAARFPPWPHVTLALDVLFADDRLAVVNKPAGLMVHDSALARGETDFAADRLREQFGKPVFLVHRLDRATSGCLLLAFDRDTASALGKSLMSQAFRKDYLAVCRGWPEPEAGVIDHPLDGGPGKPQKKPAITTYRRLATAELDIPSAQHPTSRYALLRCSPQTGRFRQIRRHLKHIHHHMIGDSSHGDGRHNTRLPHARRAPDAAARLAAVVPAPR